MNAQHTALVREAILGYLDDCKEAHKEYPFPDDLSRKEIIIKNTIEDFLKASCSKTVEETFRLNYEIEMIDWCDRYIDEWKDAMSDWEIEQWRDGENDYLVSENIDLDKDWFDIEGVGVSPATLKKHGLNWMDYLKAEWCGGYYANTLDEDLTYEIDNSGYIGETTIEWEPDEHETFMACYSRLSDDTRTNFESNYNFADLLEHPQGMYTSVDGSLIWYIEIEEVRDALLKAIADE
jgi:hypothetical protein